MRVKRQKNQRKAVRFYRTHFGFREPYKVLCDGTFIHNLIVHELTPADDKLSHLLGGKVQLFTTSCVIGELKSLGKNYEETLQAAQMLVTARCDHEKRVNPANCVHSVIGEDNTEHFFVATQDKDIKWKLSQMPSVPVIYGLRNALFLNPPSKYQKESAQSAEEKRLHVSDFEYQKLKQIKLKENLENPTYLDETSGDVNQQFAIRYPAKKTPWQKLGVMVDKARFKRNKAKGPNPLSCKKKKEKNNSSTTAKQVISTTAKQELDMYKTNHVLDFVVHHAMLFISILHLKTGLSEITACVLNGETDAVAKKRKRTRKRNKASSNDNAGGSGN